MPDHENVRVDLLKVRYKVYSAYPPYSKERRTFVKEAKTIVLKELVSSTQQLSPKSLDFIVSAGQKLMIKDSIKGGLLLILFFCLFYAYPHLNSRLENISIIVLQGIIGYWAIRYYKWMWATGKSLRGLGDYYEKLHNKMKQINDDIKKLDGPNP